MKKIAFILALAASVSFCADQLIIAAGGGYKKPVSAVIENLKKEGMDVAGSFANLGQLVIQSRENKISFIVGDEAFLKKSDLNITKFERVGRGTLVLVTPKNIKIQGVSEIAKFDKIAMPDPKKAIYGIRTNEFLQNAQMDGVKDKILAVAGVPQVVAYVINGEVQAGFINSTEAVAKKMSSARSSTLTRASIAPHSSVSQGLARAAMRRFAKR
ncbi:substrate-binding domain-containing protein [uncultured Campylobacter sp.]|uniref:molybdate ABC transporter substrate-binding protein n=1 Tax=uncultured Campylobacter sp. TaxID=218934 RepID=UPI002617118C|nr:substrate-binding domain-containing protein [uncultured Campylobacter sp.]